MHPPWLIALTLLASLAGSLHAQSLADDEQTLQTYQLPTDAKGLASFFANRTIKAGDAERLKLLVHDLGSATFVDLYKAEKELIVRGPAALPFLRDLRLSGSLETKTRIDKCIDKITRSMQPDALAAAGRVLALRDPAQAAEVLLEFLPSIRTEPYLEDDLLLTLGRLTIRSGKVAPVILDALKDERPHRRAAAAYLIGRRAAIEHRAALRALLSDREPLVRQRAAEGLLGKRPMQMLQDAAAADETLLRASKVGPDAAALFDFFRKRTLSSADETRMRGLIQSLGFGYTVRENATRMLIKEGSPVLGLLREAHDDKAVERARRAQICFEQIRGRTNAALPIAAAHALARTELKPAALGETIRVLLAYLPFCDDEAVEDEAVTCLSILSTRAPGVAAELVDALTDDHPQRRAAAAQVLGQVAASIDVARIKPLLTDPHPVVRLRAAQGLLAARDRAALPILASLVESLPVAYLPRIEDALSRLADDRGPQEPITPSADARHKAAAAWSKWLADHQAAIDLANLDDRGAYLGLITICEYDTLKNNNINGRAWETSRTLTPYPSPPGRAERGEGGKRWSFEGLTGAMDAHALPNGRVLVVENNLSRVSERDQKGKILWEYRVPTNPICCQRLPNGNTFIACYNTVMEIKPNKTEVYRYTPGPQFFIFSAHKAKNGNIVAITAQGRIVELDAKTGKELHSVQTNTLGNWCSVELQPNGNYLVASMSSNSVRELDRKTGAEVWSKPFAGAFRATRLPNGNVLVASMTAKEVVEMDRTGAIRWRTKCNGRPWSVHYR